jgi:hypothetical protein
VVTTGGGKTTLVAGGGTKVVFQADDVEMVEVEMVVLWWNDEVVTGVLVDEGGHEVRVTVTTPSAVVTVTPAETLEEEATGGTSPLAAAMWNGLEYWKMLGSASQRKTRP